MAITKVHALSNLAGSTRNAVDYILDPEKTDGKILVSSSHCSAEHAAHEFLLTRNLHYPKEPYKTSVRSAVHIIQSFSPEDPITEETAHEISCKLAKRIFQDNYQYLVSTHIDKKHIHSHILANAYAINEKKKFHMDGDFYVEVLRKNSDELCKEYGLNIIENEKPDKGKSYKEYSETKKGNSWKEKLKDALDEAIKTSNTYENFLQKLKESGIEIKQGKHIAFRQSGQTRFTRGKTIGERYSEEGIKLRLADKKILKEEKSETAPKVERYIDTENNLKAKNNRGYMYWANKFNLNQSVHILNYMIDRNIDSVPMLIEQKQSEEKKLLDIDEKIQKNQATIQTQQKILDSMKVCMNTQDTVKKYRRLPKNEKEKFHSEHKTEIETYEQNREYLKRVFGDKQFPKFKELTEKIQAAREENLTLYSEKKQSNENLKELRNILSNLEEIFKQDEKNPQEISPTQEKNYPEKDQR